MGKVAKHVHITLLCFGLVVAGCTPQFTTHSAALSYDLQRLDPLLACFAKGQTNSGAALPTFGALKWLVTGRMSPASFENPSQAQKVMAAGTAIQKRDRFLEYVLSVADDLTEAKQMVQEAAAIEYACSSRAIESNLAEIRKARSQPSSHRYYWGGRPRSNQETLSKLQSLGAANKENRRLTAALYRNIITELDAASEKTGPVSVRADRYEQPKPRIVTLQPKSSPQRQSREGSFEELWRQREGGLFT